MPLADPLDERQLDMVVYGATPTGIALCCDATLVSPLTRAGAPIPRAATEDGIALARSEQRKRHRYPELLASPLGQLVVLANEVGGRWNQGSLRLVAMLAKHKARSAPQQLRGAARAAWHHRWWGLLSVAAQRALAATLSGEGAQAMGGPSGSDDPPLAEVLEMAQEGPPVSRLPLRGW